MRILRKGVLIIYAFAFFAMGYFLYWTMEKPVYTYAPINTSSLARKQFLNETFCGTFIDGTWNGTIDYEDIKQRHRLLKDQIKYSNVYYNNLSCPDFIAANGFYSKYITPIERDNPMAFTILVYKHLYQFRVLMRTLYVRTNLHCIHVDQNATPDFYLYALKLATCLENVHVIDTRIDVKWGDISILEAERLCQRILLNQSSAWYYYIPIAGTELPIQTNLNRVQILQLAPDKSRIDVASALYTLKRQASKKTPPPNNMTMYKGGFHGILTRDFVKATHTHPLASQLFDYLNGTKIPDEHFYSALIHLRDFPDAKAQPTPTYSYDQLLSHYKIWRSKHHDMCQSKKYRKGVCQFNYKDLAMLEKSGRLFANKFNQEYDLVGIDCWERWFKVKENNHQDIDPRKYIDQYPFFLTTRYLR